MDGVIYVAEGPDYYDLAVQSGNTLRQHNPEIAIDIFTDQVDQSNLFDRVLSIPEGPTSKLASLPHSRFSRTLYLDCDTLVLAPFGDLFDLLERFDLAVSHDVRRASSLIREGWEVETPYAFPQMNAGVILYSQTAATCAFLREWQLAYESAGRKRDQVTFRDLLWSSNLAFYVLPEEFNLRRLTQLDAWEPLDVRPTIIHSHRLLQHLRTGAERIMDVDTLIRVERAALKEEWSKYLDDAAGQEFISPVERFHRAEKISFERGDKCRA